MTNQDLMETPRSLSQMPGTTPPGRWFGHLSEARVDSLAMIRRAFRECGDLSRFRFGPISAVLLARPEHIEQVLLRHHDRYDKQIPSYQLLKSLLGLGLLTSEGELWQRQRRIAQPAFHRRRLHGFVDVMVEESERTVERWRREAGPLRLDMHREMMALTLRIVARCLLGADLDAQTEEIGRSLDASLEHFDFRLHHPFSMPEWVPTPRNLKYRRHLKDLDRLIYSIIADRRAHGHERDDLLAMLMEARDEETGESMSDTQLRDEAMTLMMAGHETTANGLTFSLWLLARHPEITQRLREELDAQLGGRAPTLEDVSQLPFTKQVFDEAMRLYPPAWMVERRSHQADEIGGYSIEPGTVVLLSPWITHHHPELWPDPDCFDPDRFAPGSHKERHRFAYFPFGGGPRVCVGGAFALMEARLVLAILAQHFDVEAIDEKEPELEAGVTLRPKGGLSLVVTPRSS